MNRVTLSPLFRRSVGFDRFNDLFEATLGGEERVDTYPPYNITKHGDDNYQITMALAGFSADDITIIKHKQELKVSGKTTLKEEEGIEYLHRGIAARAFERTFSLADHVSLQGKPDYKNGLLTINLERIIPDEEKPQMIEINDSSETVSLNGQREEETN
jgi:molecular chaperone IbpA